MNDPILVTGGSGFVGVNLIRTLVGNGHSVRALVRSNSPRMGIEIDGVSFVEGDVSDFDSVLAAAEGCRTAFHVAGWVNITPWGEDIARKVNVLGTENICQACLEVGIDRLVHTSSIAAVAHGPLDDPADENSEWNLDVVRAPYYTTKYQAEQVVHHYVRETDLDAVIVNPGYVVGPHDIKPTSGRLIIQIAAGKVPGYPNRGGIGFVDVRDVVDGMLLAHEKAPRGERYILVGENLSYGEYSKLVAEVAGVNPPKFRARYWLLYPPAMAATLLGRLGLGQWDDFNITVLRTGFCEHYLSNDKSRNELGLTYRSLRDSIRDSLSWFESNGYVERHNGGWIESSRTGQTDRCVKDS